MKLTAVLIQFEGKQRLTTSHVDLAHELERLQAPEQFRTHLLAEHASLLDCPLSSSKMLIGGAKTWKMRKTDLDLESWERFTGVYFNELEATWTPETHKASLQDTFTQMTWALIEGNFGKDTVAFKNTCKVLKIKHTYKAIQNYLNIGGI